MSSVIFGSTNVKTLGLILTSYKINKPETKTNYVDIPGRSGSLDMTDVVTGKAEYRDREASFTLYYKGAKPTWPGKLDALAALIEGKVIQITLEEEPLYHYTGRLHIGDYANDGNLLRITVSGVLEPFKWSESTHVTAQVQAGGTVSVTLPKAVKDFRAKSSTGNTLSFDGGSYSFTAGVERPLYLPFKEGRNDLIFSAAATIQLTYTGGNI